MCLLRSFRNANFRCIMVRVRIGIRLRIVVVYMRLFYEEILRQTRWWGVKSSIFPILFTIIEICLFVSVLLAYLDGEYEPAMFGAVIMFCSIPYLGMAWGMRD